jgi:H+/gluconate symporter-like permease
MKTKHIIALVIIAMVIVAIYTQITIFVIPPIGALPEGKTVIITRLNKTKFIDSPDGMCERIQSGVSLLCRGMVIGAVLEKSIILLRLPYSSWLYRISTGGKTYDR